MPDQIFENPRLAAIYDYFDGNREDLTLYLSIAEEFGAKSILDIGCGTGCLAGMLVEKGFDVTGLEPANASLNIARGKPFSEGVKWIQGFSTDLPPMQMDLATMTGNVAQVFVTDESWEESLSAIRKALRPGGHLVFEARDPAMKAWENWTRDNTYKRLKVPGVGFVEGWCEVTNVSKELVSFRWIYNFESDGESLTSNSTIRFREKEEIRASLEKVGFQTIDIRDAPDRPGKELVFIAAVPIIKNYS